MSLADGLPLLVQVAEDVRGSWTSYASWHIFTWAVKRCGLSSSALHTVHGRTALAVWLGELDLRVWGEGDSPDVCSECRRGNAGLVGIVSGEPLDPQGVYVVDFS